MPPFMRVADPSPPPSPPTPPTSRVVGGEAVGGARNSLDAAATASLQSLGNPPPLSVGSTLTITTVGSTVSTSTAAVADDVARLAGRHSFSNAPTGRLRRRSSAALPRVRSTKAGGNGFLARLTTGEGGRLHRGRTGGGGRSGSAPWSTSFKVGPRGAGGATAADEPAVPRGGLVGGDARTTHDRVARLRTRGAVATASLVPGEWDAENEEDMAELAARVKQQAGAERRAGRGGRRGGGGTPSPQNVKINLMRQAVVREPATLRLARGGRSPVHDGFVVVANAVRRELFDLYYMLASMSKRTLALTSLDIEEFVEWLPGLRSYLTDVLFTYEMDTLIPLLIETVPPRNQTTLLRAHPRPLQAIHTTILSLLEAVESTPTTYAHQPPGALLKQILVAVDDFAPVVLKHLDNLSDSFLPSLVVALGLHSRRRSSTTVTSMDFATATSPEAAERLGAAMCAGLYHAVAGATDPGAAAAATARPLRTTNAIDAWKEPLLGMCGGGPLARLKWKRVVIDGGRRWKRQHVGIVRRFYKRWAVEYKNVRVEKPMVAATDEEHVDRDVWGKAEIEVDSDC